MMELFNEIVEAVEENNRCNDGEWSDWKSFKHITTNFEIEIDVEDDNFSVCKSFVEALIRNGGNGIATFKKAFDLIEYGYEFNRK